MKIVVVGTEDRLNEFRKTIPATHDAIYMTYEQEANQPLDFTSAELIADLNLDEQPHRVLKYAALKGKVVIGCAVKKSLGEISANQKLQCHLVGLNCLPTFMALDKKEVSFTDDAAKSAFTPIAVQLGWNWLEVKDAVGMVSPRVIMMLINEACFTLHEQTATRNDIDKGMKLGTAYPTGPLQWADNIGLRNVYETIDALHKGTGDARYTISPLLKEMYASGQRFYP